MTAGPIVSGRTALHAAGPQAYGGPMKAIVVYESHWGNTAAIAQAIADGIGSGTRALNTDEATREALAGVDLIVAGSPVIAFALPRDGSLNQIAKDEKAPVPPDTSHPLLRTWLHNLPVATGSPPHSRPGSGGRCAAQPARSNSSSGSPATSVSSPASGSSCRAATGRSAKASSNEPVAGVPSWPPPWPSNSSPRRSFASQTSSAGVCSV